MRAPGSLLVTIACFALHIGCGGEDPPVDDYQRGAIAAPDEPMPAAPTPMPPSVKERVLELGSATEQPAPIGLDTETAPPKPGEVELIENDGLALAELAVARNVEKRKPVEAGDAFSIAAGTKLYAFMIVDNPDREESEVSVHWRYGETGKERGGVTVKVGAQPRWRTWAYHSHVNKPGLWYAIVRNADGAMIGRAPFTVVD